MSKPLPIMTTSMTQTVEHLINQQLNITNGQHNLVQKLGSTYARRSIPTTNVQDNVDYIVTTPLVTVDIETMKFTLLIGSVIIKSGKHLVVMSGCMSFEKELTKESFSRPLKEAGFIIESLEGKVTTLQKEEVVESL